METAKTLSMPAQRIIFAKLNHCFDNTKMSTGEIGEFLGYGNSTMFPVLNELEELHLIDRVHGWGEDNHSVYIHWAKEQRPLWEATKYMMSNPIVRYYNIETPENMDDFVISSQSLLPYHNHRYELHSTPAIAYKGASRRRTQNESFIKRTTLTKADYVCEFWSYPPPLPSKAQIDPLSPAIPNATMP